MRFLAGLVSIALLAAPASRSAAAPSDLDADFGRNGVVVTPLATLGDVAVDGMNRLLIATATPGGLVVVRYDAPGTLDAGFGLGGVATIPSPWEAVAVLALTVQPDGRPVLVVLSESSPTHSFGLLRLTTDGALDATFQQRGFTEYDYPSRSFGRFVGLLAGADGTLDFAMVAASLRTQVTDFEHWRFDRDGGLLRRTSTDARLLAYERIASDSQGRLIATEETRGADDMTTSVAVTRHTPEGAIDPSFGLGGHAATGLTAAIGNSAALATTSDAGIVVGSTDGEALKVARLDANGAPDASFGAGGIATVQLGPDVGLVQLATTPDGRVVASTAFDDSGVSTWRVVALSAAGAPDLEFGTAGILTGSVPASLGRARHPVVVRPDGRIVIVGRAQDRVVVTQLVGFPRACADADGNAEVTVTDGVRVLRAAAGLSSPCRLDVCDVDGSGAVSVTDGVRTLRAAAGLDVDLRCRVPRQPLPSPRR